MLAALPSGYKRSRLTPTSLVPGVSLGNPESQALSQVAIGHSGAVRGRICLDTWSCPCHLDALGEMWFWAQEPVAALVAGEGGTGLGRRSRLRGAGSARARATGKPGWGGRVPWDREGGSRAPEPR
ncbi:hypothetical protein P7K49_002109 [Saguinus oedipus]|uniref:Uncharacterized protein n=1 Tax=Saguinus oedipus TaxID=9490 RepID=A0ABQ9WGH0_SAGOE|nr:hypothetical protein P7K49_002109 [Saguinus oedipus]